MARVLNFGPQVGRRANLSEAQKQLSKAKSLADEIAHKLSCIFDDATITTLREKTSELSDALNTQPSSIALNTAQDIAASITQKLGQDELNIAETTGLKTPISQIKKLLINDLTAVLTEKTTTRATRRIRTLA